MTRQSIYKEIQDAVYDIIIKHQDQLGIESGDEYIDIDLPMKLLADWVEKSIRYQLWSNGLAEYFDGNIDMDTIAEQTIERMVQHLDLD